MPPSGCAGLPAPLPPDLLISRSLGFGRTNLGPRWTFPGRCPGRKALTPAPNLNLQVRGRGVPGDRWRIRRPRLN